MKIKNLLLGSTLILSSLLGVVSPAEARPSRTITGTLDDGTRYGIDPIGYNSVEFVIYNPYNGTGFIGNMDCSNGRYQWRANTGYSQQQIGNILEDACNF